MEFDDYWQWLQTAPREFATLARQSSFSIQGVGAIISSTGKRHKFTKEQALNVWNRYHELPVKLRTKPEGYSLGQWEGNRNKTCDPWLAATIRDFYNK